MSEITPPTCSNCQLPMGRAGWVMSGTNKIQRYKCNHCGITTTKLGTGTCDGTTRTRILAVPFNALEYAQLEVRSLKASMDIVEYIKTQLFREH